MSSLYIKRSRRKDGTHTKGVAWLSFTDQWGRRHELSTGVDIEKTGVIPPQARAIQRKIELEVSNKVWGLNPRIKAPTLSDAAKEYLAHGPGANLKPRPRKNFICAVERLKSFAGDLPLSAYTIEEIYRFRSALKKSTSSRSRKGESIPLTPEGISWYLRCLSPLFTWAVGKGLIAGHPITKEVKPRIMQRAPFTFTADELAAVLDHARTHKYPHLADVLEFLSITGWRSGESCALTWRNIHWNKNYLLRIDEKSGAECIYPLGDELRTFLQRLPRNGESVFAYRTHVGIGKAFRKMRDETQLSRRLHVHLLRAYATSRMLERGMDLGMVAEILGHKDIRTTRRHYASYTLSMKLDALNRAGRSKSA